jgi:tetratricopeptide (TPR) repeat protein
MTRRATQPCRAEPAAPWTRWAALWPAALVALAALLVRLIYLIESADYPAFTLPIIDARGYDQAARQLAETGRLTPQFFWQPFFYPTFLAGLYALNGGAVLGVKMVQVLVGALTCGLTCRLGQRIFGLRGGLLAGGMLAVYGPLIFYDAELLAAGWATFWMALLLVTALAARDRGSAGWGLLLGIAGGLALITRPTFLLPLLGLLAWWLLLLRGRWQSEHDAVDRTARQRSIRLAVAPIAGLLLITLPVVALNRSVTGHAALLPASGGINVFIGNDPDPNRVATAVGFEWDRLQRLPEAEGIDDLYGRQQFFYRRTLDQIAADPAAYARGLGRKAAELLAAREIPRSVNVYAVHPWSALQRALTWKIGGFGFPFGVLLPLAVIGGVWRWRAVPGPIWIMIALYGLAIVLVFVTGRYRLPLVPPIAVLAAGGVLALGETWRGRRWRAALGQGGVAAVTVLVATLPGPFALERIDFESGLKLGIAHAYRLDGDNDRARQWYERVLADNPQSVPALTELASICRESGRAADALDYLHRAVEARPELSQTHANYAAALLETGRADAAIAEMHEAIECEPRWAMLYADLAAIHLSRAEYAPAAAALSQAVTIDPRQFANWYNLGVALGELGDLPAAVRAFEGATQVQPNHPQAHFLLGVTLEQLGQVQAAAWEYQTTLRLAPQHAEARQRLQSLQQPPSAP